MEWPKTFIVTGTDTGVGKTVVSAMLASALGADYWKPIQSGLEEKTDTDCVRHWTGLAAEHFHPESYRLQTPASPHLAAAIDGVEISMDQCRLPCTERKHLVVEGAGGLMVPINATELMIDLFEHWQLPVLLVARSGLGTLNHTLLSIEALRKRQIPLLGIVLNGPEHKSNVETLEHWGKAPILATVPVLNQISRIQLQSWAYRLGLVSESSYPSRKVRT